MSTDVALLNKRFLISDSKKCRAESYLSGGVIANRHGSCTSTDQVEVTTVCLRIQKAHISGPCQGNYDDVRRRCKTETEIH